MWRPWAPAINQNADVSREDRGSVPRRVSHQPALVPEA